MEFETAKHKGYRVDCLLALTAGLVTLGVDGLRFARYEGLGHAGTLAAVGLNLALGLMVVALKVAVMH